MSDLRNLLFDRLERQPRQPLGQTPTPIEALPNLAAALGLRRLAVKRDDLTGLGFGGNKVRQLEPYFGAARAAGLSDRQLNRLFKRQLDTTPGAFATKVRLRRARSLLEETDLPIAEVALACGYAGSAEFARAWRRASARRSPLVIPIVSKASPARSWACS